MKLVIASDHAGFALKRALLARLREEHAPIGDLGASSAEPSDYPDFAEAIGMAIRAGRAERGILICGSGVGACVAANKIPGIRAGLCHDSYSAHQGVEHDDMNVLVLGARVIGRELASELVSLFLRARFEAGVERHARRVRQVLALERHFCKLSLLEERVLEERIEAERQRSGAPPEKRKA